MPLSGSDLREIAARAVVLDERLAGVVQPGAAADASSLATRLQHWARSLGVARFGLSEVATHLGQADLGTAGLLALLGPVCWPAESALPYWAYALAALVEAVEADTRM